MCTRSVGLVLLALVSFTPQLVVAQPILIQGEVQMSDGTGIPYANVRIAGTTDGAATNEQGRFQFRTRQTGRVEIRASAVGYEASERTHRLVSGDTARVTFVLTSSRVQLDEAVVTGEAYSTGSGEAATLSPTEAVTTPGANGDLFRALQSFPGVAAPGDGAGLFVRGGDVTETKTLLDQATVHHPYRYESPGGGSFGAVRPFLVDGTQFSTGGFSAQYGNALSGILAMESKDRPQQTRRYVNLGLAAASLSIDQPIIEDELGFRLSGNRSFTGLLFRVNGERNDYVTVPQGVDGNLGLTWDYSATGRLKLFAFARRNRIGVETTDGAFAGVYRSRSTNQLYNLQWTAAPGAWTVETSMSWSAYSSDRTFGALDLSPTDAAAKLRVDASRSVDRWTLRTGGRIQRRRYRMEGAVPLQPTVIGPDASTQSISATTPAVLSGGYAEIETRMLSPLSVRLGVRADHHSRADKVVVDPRIGVSWPFAPHTRLRAAWGCYHQFPALATYSAHVGENVLQSQSAQHYVVGLRHERADWLLRAEAYRKPYRNLVVRTGPSRYANDGTGLAQGVNLFAKYGAFLDTRFNGWVSYSLLESRRTQPRDRGPAVQLEEGPAPFDLTHQATVVGKVRVVDQVRLGATYRYTTGQAFTPVVGTERSVSGRPLPVDGPVGSARLPSYQRLDLQLSYYWPFNRHQHLIAYAAVNNSFDRANAVDVTYSSDYSERQYRTTDFRRSVYAGFTLTL